MNITIKIFHRMIPLTPSPSQTYFTVSKHIYYVCPYTPPEGGMHLSPLPPPQKKKKFHFKHVSLYDKGHYMQHDMLIKLLEMTSTSSVV